MSYRALLTILYGLFVIWTGLLRSIQAVEFKPNSFWFCLATGLIVIAGAYLMQLGKPVIGTALALVPTIVVLGFYLNCFVTQPEKDATYRVALVIIASIGELCVLTLPEREMECVSRGP